MEHHEFAAPNPESIVTMQRISRILGEKNRFRIACHLIQQPDGLHVKKIQELLMATQEIISHHLASFGEAGYVRAERDGQSIRYTLTEQFHCDAAFAFRFLDACA